jgi:patatin-like phospholipase/acyl hydrolase
MEYYLGDSTFDDILTDEVMVVAYDYNSQEPRFYTKWYAKRKQGIYGETIE